MVYCGKYLRIYLTHFLFTKESKDQSCANRND
nr:MAG TPA_asm: CooJ [Caudoviricetes sp.]